MSLQTVKFFTKALASSSAVAQAVAGRVSPVGRPIEAEQRDEIPYVVVMPDGIEEVLTKDGCVEETAPVTLIVVAETFASLVDLAQAVRDAVEEGERESESWNFKVADLTFSAAAPQIDAQKPCYFQELHWSVITEKAEENGND